MQTITKNSFYQISVNKNKNRFYVKIIGLWDTPGIIPQYIEHIRIAVGELASHFTAVLDLSDMKSHPKYVEEQAHQAASLIAIKKGLSLSVQILPQDPEAKLQIERIAQNLGKQILSFEDIETAERFLDMSMLKGKAKKAAIEKI